jgi:carbonic anhydrase/acetyltransferase-like protein (isoleucine patch superfamily)
VTIGVKAIILPGVEVGEYSIVGPGSIVNMDTIIPPNEYWEGTPAQKIRDIKHLNKYGAS